MATACESDLSLVPEINFTFVESYTSSVSEASGKAHVSKGYTYFSEGYIHGVTVSKATGTNGCDIKGRCFHSMKKNERPHNVQVILTSTPVAVQSASCTCAKGQGAACGHITGLLYQLANYKSLKLRSIPRDVAKTSQPQRWHEPRGEKIHGHLVSDLTVRGYGATSSQRNTEERRAVTSSLMNPLRDEMPSLEDLRGNLESIQSNVLMLPALQVSPSQAMVVTRFGNFAKGSVLAVQQKLHSDYLIQVYDGVDFPQLPSANKIVHKYHYVLGYNELITVDGLSLNADDAVTFEEQTRLQSQDPLWYKLRRFRITASKAHGVFVRRGNFDTLVTRLLSTRFVQTAAMKEGIRNEPVAVEAYSKLINNGINIYPCVIIISCWAPWLAASPDRKIYDPRRIPPFGLLEVKCPQSVSVHGVRYLQERDDGLTLKRTHEYYTQIQMQLAITGLEWCDLFVWTEADSHREEIRFDPDMWQNIKDKLDLFYFNYFLPASVKEHPTV